MTSENDDTSKATPKATKTSKKKSARRKAPKSPEPITADELKTWLEGVESMQDDDWCPDFDQWKKIRAKIELLMDSPPIIEAARHNVEVSPHTQNAPQVIPSLLSEPEYPNGKPQRPVNLPAPEIIRSSNKDGFIDASPRTQNGDGYESSFT